jgi:D-aspartate ligase
MASMSAVAPPARLPAGVPPAVVLGLDSMQGLQTARILAWRGVPVIGVVADGDHYAAKTRVCEEIVVARDRAELLAFLEGFGMAAPQPPVLVPCQDSRVATVSTARDHLAQWYRFVLPPAPVVDLLMDKTSFYPYAAEHGFPIPTTFLIRSRDDALDASSKLAYPAIVKPGFRTTRWSAVTQEKAFKVATPDELLSVHEQVGGACEVLIAQEWIPGKVSDLYSCNCYFSSTGEVLATFVAKKLRQWPRHTGQSSMGVEVRDDEVLDVSIRLLRSVGYRGLGYVELKRDARDGHLVIIEPNVGRPTGRSAIAEAGGVELLLTAYCDAVGLPLPEQRTQQYGGAKWIHLRRDLLSAAQAMWARELGVREWVSTLRGTRADAVLSWKDPRPFVAELALATREVRTRTPVAAGRRVRRWAHGAKRRLIDGALLLRGAWFLGARHACPCCGWRMRAFTHGGGSFRSRRAGYCPRCNAKARHRRVWLFLEERTALLRSPHRVLEVAPHRSLVRALSSRPGVDYMGVDLEPLDGSTIRGDVTDLPLDDELFDAVLCVHVLEHVEDDRAAMGELHRVLRPGGWALVNVPYDPANPTYEDAAVTSDSGRRAAFGEATHVRVYGTDLRDRLESVGFDVTVDHGCALTGETVARYGLTTDESIFLCKKPRDTTW